jgi:hypothetical protein
MAVAYDQPLPVLVQSILVDLDIVDRSFSIAACNASWLLPSVTIPETALIHLLLALQVRPLYSLALVHPFFFGVLEFGQGCAKSLVKVQDWLSDRELDLDWLGCGLPESLHLDNAQKFKSEALERGHGEYGIKLIYRPPRPASLWRAYRTAHRHGHGRSPSTAGHHLRERWTISRETRSAGRRNSPTQAARVHGMTMPAPVILRPSRSW